MYYGNPLFPHRLRTLQGHHGGGKSTCGGRTTHNKIEHKQSHKGIQISSKSEYIFGAQHYVETKQKHSILDCEIFRNQKI